MGKWPSVFAQSASAKALALLVLLAFLVSGWIGPGRLAAEAQPSAPTDTPLPTETKDNLVTATYDPLTPTATPFPATPTKSGDVGGLGLVSRLYLPLMSSSVQQLPPTVTPLPTLTAPAPPPASLSRYLSMAYSVDWTDYNNFYALGRQRGGCDGSSTPALSNGFLILAFGHPWADSTDPNTASVYGVGLYPDGSVKMTLDSVEANVEWFLMGYHYCVSRFNPYASLTLAVGINGSVPTWITYQHGQRWAQMIGRITDWIASPPSWASTIKVAGAVDFEPGFIKTHVASLRQWAEGYASISNSQYYYYGSCDGCPAVPLDASGNYVASYAPVLVTDSDWTMDDVWYLAYGVRPAYPVPEIYSETLAREWENLADWAATCYSIPYTNTLCEPQRLGGNRSMQFSGAMTQHQACIDLDYDPKCYPLLFNEPPVGWQQLWQALNNPNTPVTNQGASALQWSTDISWKR